MPCAPLHITKMDFKIVHPLNILSTDFITIYPKSFKMKNKHFFRRAITAALLCICFHSQYLYAQKLNGNHPKSPVLLNKKLASSSLASFFIIEGKHLLHLLLTSVVSQIV